MKYILSLDQGTTSSRALLFNENFNLVDMAQQEFTQIFPQPAWVEHDPNEIWESQLNVCKKVIEQAGIQASDIAGIGITNQRETIVAWDRETGEALCNAIVWQDRRTAAFCDELKANNQEDNIRSKTGLVIDAYFSGTKMKWMLDNVDAVKASKANGSLLFGTVDSWLVYKLSGGKTHVTDYSNASRTLVYNIHELRWDEELMELMGIQEYMLPTVRPSSEIYTETDTQLFGHAIPVCGIAGDQQAALFGQACFNSGESKNTYGTGCFMLMNTGNTAVSSQNGLLTTIAWGLGGEVEYALEGSVFVAGAAIQWLRDQLQIIEQSGESQQLAESVEDNGGVYFVPAFVGLGAPYWDSYARGAITGLTRGSSRAHIARAALESIAYQTDDVLSLMEKESGIEIPELKVDGGATANHFLMQFQSDILNKPVRLPEITETTAMGAAYLAAIAVGMASKEDIKRNWKLAQTFESKMETEERDALLAKWKDAVSRCRSTA